MTGWDSSTLDTRDNFVCSLTVFWRSKVRRLFEGFRPGFDINIIFTFRQLNDTYPVTKLARFNRNKIRTVVGLLTSHWLYKQLHTIGVVEYSTCRVYCEDRSSTISTPPVFNSEMAVELSGIMRNTNLST